MHEHFIAGSGPPGDGPSGMTPPTKFTTNPEGPCPHGPGMHERFNALPPPQPLNPNRYGHITEYVCDGSHSCNYPINRQEERNYLKG